MEPLNTKFTEIEMSGNAYEMLQKINDLVGSNVYQ